MKTCVFVLFAILAGAFAGDVLDLTEDNFDSTIKDKGKILVKFFAPWCGHCKALAPEYEKAAASLGDDHALAKVDCTEQEEICKKHGIQGYPTLKWFADGEVTDYNGPREAAGIEKWIKKRSSPPAVVEDKDGLATFTANGNAIVGFFPQTSGSEYEEFTRMRNNPDFDDFDFAETTNADLFEVEGLTPGQPGLKLYTEHTKRVIQGDFKTYANEVNEWGFPLVTDIQANRFGKLAETKKFVVVLFTGADPEADLATLSGVGSDFRADLGFVSGPGEQYAQHASQLGITGKKFPTLVAIVGQKYYPFDEEKDVNAENLKSFFQGLLDGSVKPHFKSEAIPEENDGPVRVLVGHSFEDEVINSDKDVFVEFYAPWCGHCKSLAPTWEELGTKFAKHDDIVIAKIDATANDHPVEGVQGFPTLKYFKAGSKDAPLDYNGARTLDGFVAFIKENSGKLDTSEKDEL